MHVRNMKPEDLQTLENAFRMLKEIHFSKTGIDMIEETLEKCMGDKFQVTVVPADRQRSMFVMSIFPEFSTVEKIIDIVTSGKSDYAAIRSLWEKNTKWTVEIDEMVLGGIDTKPTPRELTALLLHEIGHIMYSNTIPVRITTILQYEYSKTHMENKLMLRNRIFRSIMSIPILNSCVSDQKEKSSIKDEIKADQFVKKMGYTKDLVSVMDSLLKDSRYPSGNLDSGMTAATKFSVNTVDNLRKRRITLVKEQIQEMKDTVSSPYFESVLDTIYRTWFFDERDNNIFPFTENTELEMKKQLSMEKFINQSIVQEFTGGFGKKKLEKIDPYDIDYIQVKMGEIRSGTDKMMLISYIHNKLDTVEFYINILGDPTAGKKYIVPHTMKELLSMKHQLELCREAVLKYRVPQKLPDIYVTYPKGYEG